MKKKLTAPYGRIFMEILKRDDITPKQKLIYAVIAIKQGETDFAMLTNKMIADAVGCTPRYVSESIAYMQGMKLIMRLSKGKVSAQNCKGQYGMVELDMLITMSLSLRAKYLYLIYCAAGNDHDANIWGRKKLCSEFHISHSTYYLAHKELVEKGILQTVARASGNGIQTSNINIILRTEQCEIKKPDSWLPTKVFDLDFWCLNNLDEEGRVQPEYVNFDNPNGMEDTSQDEQGVQRSLTIKSNRNSNAISKLLRTNESFTTLPIALVESETETEEEKMPNLELLSEIEGSKFKTVNEAKKAVARLYDNDLQIFLYCEIKDHMIERAFLAFDIFKEAVERYGQNTFGYALNLRDLKKFCYSEFSTEYGDDEMEYHIQRVVQLGFEKQEKPYIGFSYVISTDHGIKQRFIVKSKKKRKAPKYS